MRFTPKRFPILGDYQKRPLTVANGLKRGVLSIFKVDATHPILQDYINFVDDFPLDSSLYYVAKPILLELAGNQKLRKQLYSFINEIKPESGILLLPTFPNGQLFSYFCYQITNEAGNYRIKIGMGFKEGLDIFSVGDTSDNIMSVTTDEPLFGASLNETVSNMYQLVLLTILFKQYAPIETRTIKKDKGFAHKMVMNNEKLLNETKIPVQIIDSRWFTTIIREEGFIVRGHFGLRACGKGRLQRQLTWIPTYEKSGYKREAGRLSTK